MSRSDMADHSILSPSSSARWLSCPASALLEAQEPQEDTYYTAEGTLAHAMAAMILKANLDIDTTPEQNELERLTAYLTDEMPDYVQTYTNYVFEAFENARKTTSDARLLVEQRVDLSFITPELYGTTDAIIIADGTMTVIDFKYGKGYKVNAKGNSQMMIYATGALDRFSVDYDIHTVRMVIVQPRCENLSVYEVSTDYLHEWMYYVLTPGVALAMSGEGDQIPGEWCRFCKVKGKCRAMMSKATTLMARFKSPQLITPEEFGGEVLAVIPIIKEWVSAAEQTALDYAMRGKEIPGYTLTRSKGRRVITDADGLARWLSERGYEESKYMKPRELVSLSEIEKMVGKKQFKEDCAQYLTMSEGKPRLATADEVKDIYNPINDFENL